MTHSSEIINFINGPEAQRILRFMCFEFIKEAQFFRALGDDIPKEAEGEQAFFMSKLLRYAATHGEDYLEEFNRERRARFAPYKAVGAAIIAFGEWAGMSLDRDYACADAGNGPTKEAPR